MNLLEGTQRDLATLRSDCDRLQAFRWMLPPLLTWVQALSKAEKQRADAALLLVAEGERRELALKNVLDMKKAEVGGLEFVASDAHTRPTRSKCLASKYPS